MFLGCVAWRKTRGLVSTGVLGLFKFGQESHIEEFCKLGRLFMQPLRKFRRLEADELRGDSNEGTHWTFPSEQVKLQMEVEGKFRDIPGISGPIRYSRDADQNVNVFCMYALRRENPQLLIDPRNFAFGDAYALLMDGDDFLRRVRKALLPQGQELRWQLVDYVDSRIHAGPMGIFSKFTHFQYQSEFRIALLPGMGEDFSLDIGDLSDIITTGKLSDINGHIKVE